MKEKQEENKYQTLMEDHPILFARRKLDMTQTCMCWGIEAGEGWYTPLRDLCDQLETINLTTGKQFGLMIRAEQVKEKYGTLRFYYNIEMKVSWWRKFLAAPWDFISWIFRTKFTAEKVETDKKSGNTFKSYDIIWHPRWRYWLCDRFGRVATWIKYSAKTDKKVEVIHGAMMYVVDKLIANAENECTHCCEDCGHQIGTDWSPTCETLGWITYLCDECAAKRNVTYVKHLSNNEKRYFMGDKDITEEYLKQREKDEKARAAKKAAVEKPAKKTVKKTVKKTTKKANKNEA